MNTNSKSIYILGISCFYHDSAAAILKDGVLLAAAQEERFTRKKHDESFPKNAINYCLSCAGISMDDINYVGFYEKPLLKFERIVLDFIKSLFREYKIFLTAMPVWMKQKLWIRGIIKKELNYNGPVYFSEHHMSHAASSFFVSPFREAAILTIDGVGEWATTSYGHGSENKIKLLGEIHYPNSLGLFYSTITHYLGFKPNSAEYKVMGLAPYGKPKYANTLYEFIKIHEDGSCKISKKLAKSYYNTSGFEKKMKTMLGFSKRNPEDPVGQCHKDLAASVQEITNHAMVKMAKHVRKETGLENLCLAGGVALNCVANSEVLKSSGFKNIFIQPASGDAGGALGVSYFIWHHVLDKDRTFEMKHCFWGPNFKEGEVKLFLDKKDVKYEILPEDELLRKTAELISQQNIVGWFQGRMEWGPRALGARSILADPMNSQNWQRVNLKIKFRESFRPFAPSVIRERLNEYFEFPHESPYMLFTADVKKENIPAVTHVNKTARLQTVDKKTNPLYYDLIKEFGRLTGCPVLINTSFNIRGEPIVCTPEDAFNTFIKTDMDYLIIGNFILGKKDVLEKYPFVKPVISKHAD
jgi:carbamoyltransferase